MIVVLVSHSVLYGDRVQRTRSHYGYIVTTSPDRMLVFCTWVLTYYATGPEISR